MSTQDLQDAAESSPTLDAYAATVLAHAPDAVLLTTTDGRVLASNRAAQELLGRNDAEIRAAGRSGIAVLDDPAKRFIAEREKAGRARAILTLRRKDGSTFLAEVASTVFAARDGSSWTSMSFRDVTDAERARRALEVLADAGGRLARSLDPKATLEELTALVVPRLADVCTVDLIEEDGVARVAVAHRDPVRVEQFRQVRRRKIKEHTEEGADFVLRTGKPSAVYEVTDEWLRRATLDERHFLDARALGVRSFISVPLRVRERTIGALTLMSVGGVPLFGENDLSLVRALGERAAAAIDNARQHQETLEARRLRDEVLGVVAHDLRGPLNVIQLATTVLVRERPCEETDAIRRAVRRANALIEDLLLAARSERSTLPLERRPEGVASIVDEVHALYAPLALAREVSLDVVVDGDGALETAVVDRHRVIQMVSNVVVNAVDATKPGGRVVLRVGGDRDHVVFRVIDTGPGIAAENAARIFDRFWQAAHRRHAGAGLGLTIARAIAQAHGGDISVESELGKGATFTMTLPREPVSMQS